VKLRSAVNDSRSADPTSRPARITYLLPPSVDLSVLYQRYYLLGLRKVARVDVVPQRLLARALPGSAWKVPFFNRRGFRPTAGSLDQPTTENTSGHIGRFIFRSGQTTVKFAIDARDSHPIRDEQILDWSDVYFKANKWPSVEYDAKVLPIVNGNGFLTERHLRQLRRLRGRVKNIDLVFISNVWGGREHNVRLFEELAKLDCRKELLAIFPPDSDDEETTRFTARLESQGIPWSTQPIAADVLWDKLARARLVMLRPGKHVCIPWRMIDLLCMGACVVFDAPPVQRWPSPLVSGVHYADCGIVRPLDGTAVADTEYAKVKPTIEDLLARPAQMEALRAAAGRYFDDHAAPARIAQYVISTLLAGER
jgi:hypothetical protein